MRNASKTKEQLAYELTQAQGRVQKLETENALLRSTEQHVRQVAETMQAAGLALTKTFNLDTILETLLDHLIQLVPYDSATIFLLEGDTHLTARAVRGYERWVDPSLALAVGFDLEVGSTMHTLVTTQRSFLVPDTTQFSAWMHTPSGEHIRSWLGVPMLVGGRIIGVCSLDSTQTYTFTQDHIRLGESLAAQAAFAIENARLFKEAQDARAAAEKEKERSEKLLNFVIPIGVALPAEKDFNRLLETILLEAKSLCNADGGTLYLRTEEDQLKFAIMRNDLLNIALGGTTGEEITLPPLPLYDETTGEPNKRNVATYVALSGASINIADVHQVEGFDFSGTRAFDKMTGYRSKSFLTVPLKNNANWVIGVLQLLNAQDPETGEVIPFDEYLQQMIESLSSLAAMALEVYIREESLRQQVEQLRIEIDKVKQSRQVAEITETDYFRQLQAEAQNLRDILEGSSE